MSRLSAWIVLVLALAALGVPVATAQDPAAELGLIRPDPPQPAKDFQVASPDGRRLRLSDFAGKVVFLNFWATWCKPCEEEMPSMERLWRAFKDRGLVVLAISLDSEGAAVVTPFLRKHRLTFPVGLDPKMTVAGLYGVWALPSTYIVDRKGLRRYFANGPREWDGTAGRALFESLLAR